MGYKIEIPLSKKKLILLLIAGIIFVVVGYLGAVSPENFVSPMFRSPELIRISGIAGLIFFGVLILFILWKLFDNKPGLVLDEFGIIDNTNASRVGLVEWNDITMIREKQVMSTKFLLIHVRNPKKYIQGANNVMLKRAIGMNFKAYGTPVTITSNSIKISFADLKILITQEYERRI